MIKLEELEVQVAIITAGAMIGLSSVSNHNNLIMNSEEEQ